MARIGGLLAPSSAWGFAANQPRLIGPRDSHDWVEETFSQFFQGSTSLLDCQLDLASDFRILREQYPSFDGGEVGRGELS